MTRSPTRRGPCRCSATTTRDPCHNDDFDKAHCNQAWRWNLDYVVDPHNNTLAYFYGTEQGAYARNSDIDKRTTYDRGGFLRRAEYGMRRGSEYAQAAPLRVVFDTAERCLADCWSGAAWTSAAKPAAWPDTPWDQFCAAAPCREQGSPTFWSARRLTQVTTQQRTGATSYGDIESWRCARSSSAPATAKASRCGCAASPAPGTSGGTVTDPEITFNPGAEPLANRVDGPADQRTALARWRIKEIDTESGGKILVTYSDKDCSRATLPAAHANTKRCMPAYYSWPGTGDPTIDWFHKYVVTRVDLDDVATDQLNETTFYDYLDSPAWHYLDDEITKDKYKTWGDWRGYGQVRVRHGDASGKQTAVEYRYLRGMDGDKQTQRHPPRHLGDRLGRHHRRPRSPPRLPPAGNDTTTAPPAHHGRREVVLHGQRPVEARPDRDPHPQRRHHQRVDGAGRRHPAPAPRSRPADSAPPRRPPTSTPTGCRSRRTTSATRPSPATRRAPAPATPATTARG